MKVVGIISARMGSTRLPGKTLAPILGRPVLSLLIERVKRAKTVDEIVVATTINSEDDCIYELAGKMGIGRFRGSETDVLGRVIGAMEAYHGDTLVRLTGDNPLTDPVYIDKGVKLFLTGRYDYVANDNIELTMPRGLDVEVVFLKELKKVNENTSDAAVHEHVTLFFHQHPKKFRLKAFGPSKNKRLEGWHLAVDTAEDLALIRKIFELLYPTNPKFGYEDIVDLLVCTPDLRRISHP